MTGRVYVNLLEGNRGVAPILGHQHVSLEALSIGWTRYVRYVPKDSENQGLGFPFWSDPNECSGVLMAFNADSMGFLGMTGV